MLATRDVYGDALSSDAREERRKLLLDMARPAESLADLRALQRRQRAWLKRHPDDQRVLEEGEGLIMLEGCFKS